MVQIPTDRLDGKLWRSRVVRFLDTKFCVKYSTPKPSLQDLWDRYTLTLSPTVSDLSVVTTSTILRRSSYSGGPLHHPCVCPFLALPVTEPVWVPLFDPLPLRSLLLYSTVFGPLHPFTSQYLWSPPSSSQVGREVGPSPPTRHPRGPDTQPSPSPSTPRVPVDRTTLLVGTTGSRPAKVI